MIKINYNLLFAYFSFLFFIIYGVFTNNNIHLLIAFIFGIIPFNEFLKKEFYNWPRSTRIFIYIILVTYPISIINNSLSAGYLTLPMVMTSFGIAYLFKINNSSIKFVRGVLTVLLLYYFIAIFFLDLSADQIYVGSRNVKSIIFLALSIFLIVLDLENKYNLLIVFFVFIACVLAVGSSGIISSFILLITCYLYYFKSLTKATNISIISSFLLFILSIIYGLFVISFDSELFFKIFNSRFFGGDIRYEIWSEYFNQYLNGLTLIFGTPFDFKLQAIYNGSYVVINNVHSSYIMLHSKAGILSLFLLLAIIIRINFLRKNKIFFAGLFLVILIRSYSDTAFILNGAFNYAFYIFFLPNRLLLNR